MWRFRVPDEFHRTAIAWHRILLALIATLGLAIAVPDRGTAEIDALGSAPARVVLVVVDGLRVDEAARLPALADFPARSTALVQCALPSSTAAITTWVTGTVPTLRSFLFDFDTRPRTDGGLLAALHAAGRPAFVSGPALWTGRYGDWIDGYGDNGLGRTDAARVAAFTAELPKRSSGLLILHLDALDRAAHLNPRNVAPTLATIDETIANIAGRLAPDDLLIVTSDHGRTNSGGHAGFETVVTRTPVVAGRNVGWPAVMTQQEFAAGLRDLCRVRSGQPASQSFVEPLPVFLAAVLAVSLLAFRPRRINAGNGAVLAVGTGSATVTLLLGFPVAAALVAVVTLLANTSFVRPNLRTIAVAVGGTLALARLFAPVVSASGSLPFLIGTLLATVAVIAVRRSLTHPLILLAAPLLLITMQGQSASLSSIATGPGFALTEQLGPGVGVAATLLLHAAPFLVLGVTVPWRRVDAKKWGIVSTAAAAGLVTLLFFIAFGHRQIAVHATQLVLRVLCEVTMIGLGGGIALLSAATIEPGRVTLRRSSPAAHHQDVAGVPILSADAAAAPSSH